MTHSFACLVAALRSASLAAFLIFFPAPAKAAGEAEVTRADVVSNAVDGYVLPSYAAFADAGRRMAEGQHDLCASPGSESLHEARKDFAALVQAFSRVEYVRFGPIMEDNRLERILFWPDRRGVALRQIQAILAEKDETATTVAGLHAKSVAVQG
ncbi:MAG: hypothetical protein H7Y08_08795, partial [Rhizobiaceae bacterium]|nr:hypothetical protein [Rhizobiaceae bacterium]